MSNSPTQLVESVSKLCSFSEVAIKFNDLVEDGSSGAAQFAATIQTDPALSAALLRLANSAMFSGGRQIDSVERAINLVGLNEIRDLVFGVCAANAFRGIPNTLISVEDFWRHSLYCAAASQILSKQAKACEHLSLFTAGMLHDIGQLVMFNREPELSQQAIKHSIAENDGLLTFESERAIFGFDHTAVGLELAKQWDFPDFLQRCISDHHDPFQDKDVDSAVVIVHVANSVSVMAELNTDQFSLAPPIHPLALGHLGLSETQLLECMEPIKHSVQELLAVFLN